MYALTIFLSSFQLIYFEEYLISFSLIVLLGVGAILCHSFWIVFHKTKRNLIEQNKNKIFLFRMA